MKATDVPSGLLMLRGSFGLAAPTSGSFTLTIRNHWPREAALNGTCRTAAVQQVS